MCSSSFVRSTSKRKQQLESWNKQFLQLKVSTETAPEIRQTVLGQREQYRQQQEGELLRPREQDGQSSKSNRETRMSNQSVQAAEFQPQAESELLRRPEQDGHV
jgi:hypothetical protein